MTDESGPRIVAAGRGATMSAPKVVETVLEMVSKPTKEVSVLYLGTATFDEEEPQERQCRGLQDAGCSVTALRVSERVSDIPSKEEMYQAVISADVILVSGGNTLYAVTRWKELGIDVFIREASENGTVLCGGSAGAICWFQEGHSQSMNPALALHVTDPDTLTDEEKMNWEYMRVEGLGFLPGFCVPHHDVEQSNGIPREVDSNQMMREKPDQPCLGIDEQAALVVEGDQVRVVSVDEGATCCVKVLNPADDATDGLALETFPFTEEHGQIHIQELLADPETVLGEENQSIRPRARIISM